MKNFLFWNLNRKNLINNIVTLAKFYDIDILMFAECAISIADLLIALNSNGNANYYYTFSECDKIQIFTKFPDDFIQPIHESDRLTIRHLQLPGSIDILLAVTHFVDKRNWDEDSQNAECSNLAVRIKEAEDKIGHSRTILVGDLNMNSFQSGVVMANILHAVMTQQIALENSRIVQGKQYKFFYNPMWSLFGDGSLGPPGTYYYRDSVHKVYFWNMLDQVLIRPDLLKMFNKENLAILDFDGEVALTNNNGYPNKAKYSDHFPIKFSLDL